MSILHILTKNLTGGIIKMVMEMKNKLLKFIAKSVVLYTIICVFSSAVAGLLCYFCATNENNVWLTFFKDISVIVASTFAVSLLIGLLVEKSSKEDFYIDLVKDTLSSKTFSNRLSPNEKEEVFKNVNKNFRCNNNEDLYRIYSDVEKRFVEQNFLDSGYYFEECRYDIRCKVEKDYIEKNWTKTIYFKSYFDKKTVNELVLGGYSNKKVANMQSFELNEVDIDGNPLSEQEMKTYIREESKKPDTDGGPVLIARDKYDNKTVCKYAKKIELSNTESVVITYNYTTRTAISDNTLTVRCSHPCKKFSLNCYIENEDYEIKAVAFGFIDRAGKTPNTPDKRTVSVEFRNWILPEDGVVVIINKA